MKEIGLHVQNMKFFMYLVVHVIEGGGARGPSRVIDALHSPKLVSTFTSHDGPNCHYLGGNGLRDRVKVISLVPLVSYASRHMGQWCVILNHAPHLLGGVGVYSLDGSH